MKYYSKNSEGFHFNNNVECVFTYVISRTYALKVKWSIELFVLCNITAMCTAITKTYDDMVGLWPLLYILNAGKTHLNDKVEIGGLCVLRTIAGKLQKWDLNMCFFLKLIECIIHSIQINLDTLCREPMKINDIGYNCIGGTLNYVTYVMS